MSVCSRYTCSVHDRVHRFCGYWSASKLPHHSSSRSHPQHRRVFGRASFVVIGLHQSCHTTRLPGHIDSTVVCLVGHLLWLLVCIKAATPLVFPVTSTAPSCVWSGIFCGYWSASKLPHHSSSRSHRQHRRVFGRASFVVIGLHQSCHTTRLPGHIDSTVVCLVGHLSEVQAELLDRFDDG